MEEDDGIERGGSSASTGGNSDKGGNSKTAASAGAAAPKAKEIPTPQIDAVSDYEALVEANYKLPESYIRTKKLPAILPPGGALLCDGCVSCVLFRGWTYLYVDTLVRILIHTYMYIN